MQPYIEPEERVRRDYGYDMEVFVAGDWHRACPANIAAAIREAVAAERERCLEIVQGVREVAMSGGYNENAVEASDVILDLIQQEPKP